MAIGIYRENEWLGDLQVLWKEKNILFPRKMMISYLSFGEEPYCPMSVMNTLSPPCKLVCKLEGDSEGVYELYTICLKKLQNAVMKIDGFEIHLVPMVTSNPRPMFSYFWGYKVPSELYDICYKMLARETISLVFDLDLTLVHTLSLVDLQHHINVLERKMKMVANDIIQSKELKEELSLAKGDFLMLEQYKNKNYVIDERGNKYCVEWEVVSVGGDMKRPVVRLPKKNVIFTRINPNAVNTSLIIHIRPSWNELRTYCLNHKERFDICVCTRAEKEYGLEVWRLLDPHAQLIEKENLLNRINFVKGTTPKKLDEVFKTNTCHRRLSLIVDDVKNGWYEDDQSNVIEVVAYNAYKDEIEPALNSVREYVIKESSSFKEIYNSSLAHINQVCYEDDESKLPSPPDLGSCLKNILEEPMSQTLAAKEAEISGSNKILPPPLLLEERVKRPKLTHPPPPLVLQNYVDANFQRMQQKNQYLFKKDISLFFELGGRILREIDACIDDSKVVQDYIYNLEHKSMSIGAKRVEKACQILQESCNSKDKRVLYSCLYKLKKEFYALAQMVEVEMNLELFGPDDFFIYSRRAMNNQHSEMIDVRTKTTLSCCLWSKTTPALNMLGVCATRASSSFKEIYNYSSLAHIKKTLIEDDESNQPLPPDLGCCLKNIIEEPKFKTPVEAGRSGSNKRLPPPLLHEEGVKRPKLKHSSPPPLVLQNYVGARFQLMQQLPQHLFKEEISFFFLQGGRFLKEIDVCIEDAEVVQVCTEYLEKKCMSFGATRVEKACQNLQESYYFKDKRVYDSCLYKLKREFYALAQMVEVELNLELPLTFK